MEVGGGGLGLRNGRLINARLSCGDKEKTVLGSLNGIALVDFGRGGVCSGRKSQELWATGRPLTPEPVRRWHALLVARWGEQCRLIRTALGLGEYTRDLYKFCFLGNLRIFNEEVCSASASASSWPREVPQFAGPTDTFARLLSGLLNEVIPIRPSLPCSFEETSRPQVASTTI